MSSSPPPETAQDAAEAPAKKGKVKLILIAAPVLLLLAGGGLWFSGVLGPQKPKEVHEAEKQPEPPSYVDLPEIIANLNGAGRRQSYVKLTARIEVPKSGDVEKVKAVLPRVQDIMQTYIREMRPEELRGSAGTYRLREELLSRTNTAVAPARVSDVLFTQMLVQ